MLVSPNWQTMWLESQHCSKAFVNVPVPSQCQNVLDDLKASCCSPNKAVQLEALKCWGMWINNQNPDDWKLNTVCFAAVRPLITKKLQPLHKDVDLCRKKLSLMWNILIKVQNLMHLEGPQYILEVFLQSCLTWLSSSTGDDSESETSILIFQLLLAVFENSEIQSDCDTDLFPILSTNIFNSKKVFYRHAEKFLNIFSIWRTFQDKKVFLKLWKHFLEHCEQFSESVPIQLWHKIFKLAGQICSEKSSTIKEKLAFLHCCATTLKSALSSNKFVDFGNLFTTPCEALLKKLVELCTTECNDSCDREMFLHSKEVCEVLSNQSVTLSGYDLCISVLDVLEEFCLKSLLWGVWCGLVCCYQVQLLNVDLTSFTKRQMIFYRKLRGIAVNFELDKFSLIQDCINEIHKYIQVLKINYLCVSCSSTGNEESDLKDCVSSKEVELFKSPFVNTENKSIEKLSIICVSPLSVNDISVAKEIGKFSRKFIHDDFGTVALYKKPTFTKTLNIKFDLIKDILKTIGINSAKPLFNCLYNSRFFTIQGLHRSSLFPAYGHKNLSLQLKIDVYSEDISNMIVKKGKVLSPTVRRKNSPVSVCTPVKKSQKNDEDEEMSTPKTRSRRRAEEKIKEAEKRKKRKSFEVLVQEIVQKNKERKTEKNSKRKKSPIILKSKKKKKRIEKQAVEEQQPENNEKENEPVEVPKRKLRVSKKQEPKDDVEKVRKSFKSDGKLENYFKVITKKKGLEVKSEDSESKTVKKPKEKSSEKCCNIEKEEVEVKSEIGWKQTSLKTMMNKKIKPDKGKQLRPRSKTTSIIEESEKSQKNSPKKITCEEKSNSKVTDSPRRKLKANNNKKHVNMQVPEIPVSPRTKSNIKLCESPQRKINSKIIGSPVEKSSPKITGSPRIKSSTKFYGSPQRTFKSNIAESPVTKLSASSSGSPLTKVSPFKEVFHDHEYTKIEMEEFEAFEKKLLASKEVTETSIEKKPFNDNSDLNVNEKVATKAKNMELQKTKYFSPQKSQISPEPVVLESLDLIKSPSKALTKVITELEPKVIVESAIKEKQENINVLSSETVLPLADNSKEFSASDSDVQNEVKSLDIKSFQTSTNEINATVSVSENKEKETTSCARGRKRIKMMDSLKPSKKLKLDEDPFSEEKLPIEISEKENFEEKQTELISPSKKEKLLSSSLKNDESPKTLNGTISSRALRMIALVPESTKSSQIQRESPRVEVAKCKKAPNVDKNSRASKMLALLSENVLEPEEAEDINVEEETSNKSFCATPTVRTPVSSLKSPRSTKKRRSIRFDDAKNETVLYLTDTPPSQMLEEKEKFKKTKTPEVKFVLSVTE